MNTTELRIGNLVYKGNFLKKTQQICEIGSLPLYNKRDGTYYAPIPLCDTNVVDTTRDIYIEAEYDHSSIRFEHCNERNAICAVLRGVDEYRIGTKKYYVHELQNLYFALTGNELTLK